MDHDASQVLRWSRALVLALVVVGFGTLAHVSADGNVPGPAGFLVVGALSLLVAGTLLERQARTAFVVGLVVAGQALVHSWLTLTAGHGGAASAGHDPLGHLLADLTAANAPMAAAHLVASVAVGLWLAAGERALWGLLALAGAAFALLVLRPLPAPARTGRGPSGLPQQRPQLRLLSRSVVRRGPPVLLPA